MENNISGYSAMSLAYNVAREITDELERECIAGELAEVLLPVLSGCYSVVDYFANCMAPLETENEDESLEEQSLTYKDYENAASIMKGHIIILQSDVSDKRCPNLVDYRKIHALVGLKTVSSFILHE